MAVITKVDTFFFCSVYMSNDAILVKIANHPLLYLRYECLFFSVHGKWIAVQNKQIAWTAKRAICLFRTAIHFPWTEKKTLIPYIYNASNKDPF